jgi:hypothetical protein
MRDDACTIIALDCDIAWLTSPAALAVRITEIGRRHQWDDAFVRWATPVFEHICRTQPELWRIEFMEPRWNRRRRGDGRLYGDWFDRGWGSLGGYLGWPYWTVQLGWVRKALRRGELIEPERFADAFLGIIVRQGGLLLQRLPLVARLQLWTEPIEPTLLQWAAQWRHQMGETVPVRVESYSAEAQQQMRMTPGLQIKEPSGTPLSPDDYRQLADQWAEAHPAWGQRKLFEEHNKDSRPHIPIKYFRKFEGRGRPPR